MHRESDEVLIIGGGLAGICCALELLDGGRRVLLVDRDAAENLGGHAKESFGGIFVVGSREQRRAGMQDSPERALADWTAFAEFEPADHWPRRWAEAYCHRCRDDVYAWLKAAGIGFVPLPQWIERGDAVQGNSVPRFHIVWGTGRELATVLARRLEGHARRGRLRLRFRLRVETLIAQAGRIAGCAGVGEDDGVPFELRADCVVVAAGGINGDLGRVRRHWHADWGGPPAVLLNGAHRYADGRMHDAVERAGGVLTHLDRMWNYAAGVHHWAPRKSMHGLSVVPPRTALWLDWRGERILPPLVTGFDTRALVTAVCATGRQYSWQLLNRRIALRELAVSGAEMNPSIRDRRRLGFLRDLLFGNRWLVDTLTANCQDFVVADTLPSLVERMNSLNGDEAVDLSRVEAAAAAFDEAVRRGPPFADPQLARIAELRRWRGDRLRICDRQTILDPKAGPLMAIREFVISRKSLGGIRTDLECRALDAAGAPVEGLYAIGEAAGFGGGGMNGLRALEGTFLGGCILTGRVCGKAIAGRAPG